MFQRRWFQEEAVDETFDLIKDHNDNHPVIVAPTGCGKTAIICKLIDRLLTHSPTSNILVMCDDKRILEQDHKAIEGYFEIEVGLCSAGLEEYYIRKITVAGIQSVHRKWKDFEDFDYILIDEAHTINTKKDQGMYRRFLAKIGLTYVSLTATHFRTGHGYIHEGDDALFNCISYDMSDPEVFNRIVDEGYLKPLFSYPTALKLSGEGCRTTGGDWNEKDLSEKNDRIEITQGAVLETIHYGKKYNHWLFFAIDIKHCENIADMLNKHDIPAVAIHSQAKDVDERIADFKSGKYRAAVQVNMLTKGFDFPGIDLIADLHPTKSPIVHVQGKGRGTRPVYADGYDLDTIEGRLAAIEDGDAPHCLVLDFSGNISRLGPINRVKVKKKGEREKKNPAPMTKQCPECSFLNWIGAKHCENCDHEFVTEEKISTKASQLDIIEKKKDKVKEKLSVKEWLDVSTTTYMIKKSKKTGIDYLQVTYGCGMLKFSEGIFLDNPGYARYNALNWVKFRWDEDKHGPIPKSTKSLYASWKFLKSPKSIYVDSSGKYPKIMDTKF